MRVLVVDDEPVARRRLRRMLGRIAGVEVVGEAADGVEALAKIDELFPQVVLLDIRMPGLDGLSLALARRRLPPVIFTTAHAEFAVDAFAAEAIDYLLKPVEQGRLEEALRRVEKRGAIDPAKLRDLLERLTAGEEKPRLSASSRGSTYFVDAREISRIRADEKYVSFDDRGRSYLLDESMDSLAERLAPWGFFRVHRSELVNLNFCRALHRADRGTEVELLDGTRVPVSRRRAAELGRRLGLK